MKRSLSDPQSRTLVGIFIACGLFASGCNNARGQGTVLVEQVSASPDMEVTASFESTRSKSFHCATLTSGSCRAERCLVVTGLPDVQPAQAGTLDVRSVQDGGTVTATAGTYGPATLPSAVWTEGSMINIRASGDADAGNVGSFESTLLAPGTVSVLEPALVVTSPIGVPRLRDLPVRWTYSGATADVKVRVVLAANSMDQTSTYRIQCDFDPVAGQGSIPAAMFSYTSPPTSMTFPNVQGTIMVCAVRLAKTRGGDYDVDLAVSRRAVTDAGVSIGQAYFQ